MIKVQFMGRFGIFTQAGEVILPTAKTRLLAAYLFWHQGQWVQRRWLSRAFWGGAGEQRAAGSLRTALHQLQRAWKAGGAPDYFLESKRDAVRISPEIECAVDARMFESQALSCLQSGIKDTELLKAAESLYRGDFLEDMDADWCYRERRRLANMYIDILRCLVEQFTALGQHEAAVVYAHRWIAADPLDEAAYRSLMLIYGAMGRPAKVIEQFEHCCRVLREELGILPSDATLAIYRRIIPEQGPPGREQPEKPADNAGRMLSPDPLRNARMLLAKGEAMALGGEDVKGVEILEKALSVYERFGALAARARLVLGEVLLWLSVPLAPRMDESLRKQAANHLNRALAYYRAEGPPAELTKALLLGAEACWLEGNNNEAVLLAREGLDIAGANHDREAETKLALVLGMAQRERFRFKEAVAAFDRAMEGIPIIVSLWEMLWLTFQRGIFAWLLGDLREAEHFFEEALNLVRSITFPSLRVKVGECMTRLMMIIVLHYQGNPGKMKDYVIPPDMEKYNPEPFRYLLSLYCTPNDKVPVLKVMASWLRARMLKIPQPMLACTIRVVVEEMLAAGLWREAVRWTAVGLRLGRRRDWSGMAALFYCYRAVALVRLGRVRAAEVCLRRAGARADDLDRWVPAWLARVKALILRAKGDAKGARKHFAESLRLFRRIGDRYDARLVENEMMEECFFKMQN